jgi:hypothetical protein
VVECLPRKLKALSLIPTTSKEEEGGGVEGGEKKERNEKNSCYHCGIKHFKTNFGHQGSSPLNTSICITENPEYFSKLHCFIIIPDESKRHSLLAFNFQVIFNFPQLS